MAYNKFRKSIHGDDNQQNEIASHNKIHFSDSGSLQIVTIFACLIIFASFLYMALFQAALLSMLVTLSIVGVIVLGWIVALSYTIRHVSTTTAHVAIDKTERSHALLQAHLIHAAEQYAIYKDETGAIQFRGTVQIQEHRQFLPQAVSAPGHQETILECFDKGMSGRAIEKLLKEKKVSYREITKTLDLYRPGWNAKGIIDSDLTDSGETPA